MTKFESEPAGLTVKLEWDDEIQPSIAAPSGNRNTTEGHIVDIEFRIRELEISIGDYRQIAMRLEGTTYTRGAEGGSPVTQKGTE